ncbi:MAG: DUF4013 domain-containing protein [Methanobrevibacter sp.]|nr:DUF4013 domain-containing protein [Methanobrevibacter sp.]
MPIKVIKNSVEYCTENKKFFILILIVLFTCQFLTKLVDSKVIGPLVMSLIMTGYGLQVTQDIIHGGTTLPQLNPGKIINFGIKGNIILFFYVAIQGFFLAFISEYLKFPPFVLENLFLNFKETINLIYSHNIGHCIIFLVSGFVIVYVTTFFMELALARLADGGKLKNAFNFPRIKHAIDIIGWRKYAWGYTKIILSIIILTFVVHYSIPVRIIDSVLDAVLSFLIFIIEFIGIGNVYKVYVDSKSKSEN